MYGLSERLVEREREARGCHQKSAIPVGVPQLPAGLSSVQPPQTEQHRVKMPLGVLAALTASAGPACPTLGGCGLLNPFWDGTRGFKKKRKEKKKGKRKKQKPTILSTSLTTLNAAALGDVVHGSRRARGLWAGPIRYLNRSRQGGPSGRQPKRPRSPRDQDTSSCDCPGALFSWRWSWSSPRHCPGFACFPARPSRSRCCSSSPGRPWDSLCSRRPRRSLPCRSQSARRRQWSQCCPSVSSRCPASPAASSGAAALAAAGRFGEWLFCHSLQVSLCAIWLLLTNST